MHSFSYCSRIACVLAEHSCSAPQALDSSLAHGRRRPLIVLDRSHPRRRAQPAPRLRLLLDHWQFVLYINYHSLALPCQPGRSL
eukprot:6191654-Pleurochrysis_carterae.AAC.3